MEGHRATELLEGRQAALLLMARRHVLRILAAREARAVRSSTQAILNNTARVHLSNRQYQNPQNFGAGNISQCRVHRALGWGPSRVPLST